MPNNNKKSNILFIVQLPPPIHGASLMNQFLVNSKIVSEKFDKEVLNMDFVSSISDIGKVSFAKILKTFSILFLLIKTLTKNKFDLVYFTLSPLGGAFYRDAVFVLVLKIFSCKIVYHLHGKGISEQLNNPIKRLIYKFVFKKVFVICLSEKLQYDIKDVFNGTIFNVPNGIPESKPPPIESKRNLREIVYLSSLDRSKGVLELVEALRILHSKNIQFSAKIIGGSTKNLTVEELKNIISNIGLEEKVMVLGPKYGDDKFGELSLSGIFCFPTYYRNECFPLSILEAMMMRLVPVSSNNGAIEEIIDHDENGIIVKMNEPEKLADALFELLSKEDKDLIKLSSAARIKYRELYTIENFEKNIVDVLEKIICQKI